MKGYVEEGEYYYVKIANGAEMFLNLSLNVIVGINLAMAVFELGVVLGGSLSVTGGGKFEAGLHEFEFTGFKARAEAVRLEGSLSTVKTRVNQVKTLATENKAALETVDMTATAVEMAAVQAGAALNKSKAGANVLAAVGLGWSAAVSQDDVDGADTGGQGSRSALNASLLEAYGLEQRVAGQGTRLRGAALGTTGASTSLSVVRTNNGALTVM